MSASADIGPIKKNPSIGPLQPSSAVNILPAGIGSSCVLGEPNIIGPPLTVQPNGITSSFVAGLPSMSFPNILQPDGILSSCVLGMPTLVGDPQTIVTFGIASSFVAGLPTIIGGSAQFVLPGGIASSCVVVEPNIIGPGNTIILFGGILSSCVLGTPALTGGEGGLKVFVGNVDQTKYLVPGGMSQQRYGAGGGGGATGAARGGPTTISQTAIGRATASFDLFVDDESGYVPRANQTVILSENGTKMFAGCIKACTSDLLQPQFGGTIRPIFHIDCNDKSSICDNRVVIKTYPVGTDVQAMILDIVSNNLNGEGITTQGVNVSDTLDSAMIFNTVPVSSAFDQITALTGAQWWIDMNGVLYFQVITTSPAAPFGITAFTPVRNFASTESMQGYANKFYALSNLVVLPNGATSQNNGGDITGTSFVSSGFGWSPGDTFSLAGGDGLAVGVVDTVGVGGGVATYHLTASGSGYQVGTVNAPAVTGVGTGLVLYVASVSPAPIGASGAVKTEVYVFVNHGGQAWQEPAFNAGLAPGYVLLSLPIAALVSVTVNDTLVIAVRPLSSGIQTSLAAYYWFDGDAQAKVIFPEFYLPNIGDKISIGYIPVYQNATVQTGTPLTGTCGSGLIEGVIQVPNIDVQSQLDAIAAGFLARNGTIPFLVSYETDEPGLAVGQQQSIDVPVVGLASTTIYLTTVTFSIEPANAGAQIMKYGTAFRCVVEATTQQNAGNWLTWFERFISRTNYPLPLSRYEEANLVLAPGGSLAGGTVTGNNYVAKNAGTVFSASAQATVAPVGQNLLLNFTVNGIPLLKAPIIIPDGSVAKVYATADQIPAGATIFRGDLINCVVSYQTLVTGAVTAAGGVSFDLEWSY